MSNSVTQICFPKFAQRVEDLEQVLGDVSAAANLDGHSERGKLRKLRQN
jgi:hypothetical protein